MDRIRSGAPFGLIGAGKNSVEGCGDSPDAGDGSALSLCPATLLFLEDLQQVPATFATNQLFSKMVDKLRMRNLQILPNSNPA